MAPTFGYMVEQLQKVGFFNFFLSYLLVFAVYYGALVRSRIFGEKTDALGAIIAIVGAFYTMYYAAVYMPLDALLGSFMPRLGIVLFAIVAMYLVASLATAGE
jgi:hypothetical protein